ncbi:MAG: polysaccharide deacetylase family protein [Gammaproteobacteria bacterium]|nr:polysaccharide deacetylase family protein [Gammaproteobacteria bacterium]
MFYTLKKIPVLIANHRPIKPLLQRMGEGVIPIFMLHRIEDKERGIEGTPVEEIELFLKKLKKQGYTPMGMDELCQQIKFPYGVVKNRFIFTMDDGYLDQIEKGVPVFQRNNCPVSVALITDFVSEKSWPWDAKVRYLFETTEETKLFFISSNSVKQRFNLSGIENKFSAMRDVRELLKNQEEGQANKSLRLLEEKLKVQLPENAPDHYRPCSWNDVKRLEGQGVSFIPHTKNHCILSNLTDERAKEEIQGSIKEINKHINALPLFVYPNGAQDDYNPYHFQVLRENGIELAFTTESAYLSLNDLSRDNNESLTLPRLGMPSDCFEQEKIITKIDYIVDRHNSGKIKRTINTAYGIRRNAALKMIESLTRRRYLKQSKELDIDKISRIVFVCIGNICRSPFAEIIALSNNLDIPVISAGIEASGVDKPTPTAIKIAKEFGYSMDHLCSTRLKDIEFLDTDLLVVMEPAHLDRLSEITNKANYQTTLLGVWDDTPMLSISDPYGGTEARFRVIFSHIQVSMGNFLKKLPVH